LIKLIVQKISFLPKTAGRFKLAGTNRDQTKPQLLLSDPGLAIHGNEAAWRQGASTRTAIVLRSKPNTQISFV
jgi:hypothetical protein